MNFTSKTEMAQEQITREKKTPTTLKRKTKSIMRTKDNSNHKSDKEESV